MPKYGLFSLCGCSVSQHLNLHEPSCGLLTYGQTAQGNSYQLLSLSSSSSINYKSWVAPAERSLNILPSAIPPVVRYFMRHLLLPLTIFLQVSAFSQDIEKAMTKRIIVKTNLMNLFAQRPTLTIEKPFTKTFSTEISFVQGQVNDFLFTDHYDYNGFLVRVKKYASDLDYGRLSPYMALYLGNLKRNIQTIGRVDNTGLFGYPDRDFSANSLRAGSSLGLTFIGKKKLVIDGLMSLGYGRYIKYHKPDRNSKGYLDMQLWLSVGYCL